MPSQRRDDPASLPADGDHRSFGLMLVAALGTFASYSLLLPVVPLWAGHGGAGSTGVGMTTGVFMLTTVLTQMAMPWLLHRFGARRLLVWGGLLMAVLSVAFVASSQLWVVVAVSALRGVGFGFVSVTGSALIAVLLPAGERGRGSALYGLAVGVPNVAGLPAGVWMAEHIGHREVFVTAGITAAAGTVAAAAMRSGRATSGPRTATDSSRRRVPAPSLFIPATALITTALSAGGVVTFLAVAVSDATVVAIALFAFGLAMILGRSAAGVLSDRLRRPIALLPGLVIGVLGMAALAVAAGDSPDVSAVLGAALFGAGFGAIQSDTLIIMFHRTGPHGYGQASTVWNIAYDGGFGIGSVGVGAVAALSDFSIAYAVTAVVVATALPTVVGPWARRLR